MATKKVLELQVLLKAYGIEKTTKQIEEMVKGHKKVARAQSKTTKTAKEAAGGIREVGKRANEAKRNMEGLAQRSGSTGKDFSRMSQGMGGLVAAYATIAANVFALSSAFLVLRNAADLSSMMKSAENFSDQFGISITRITKQMQEASGGALDFAEALPSINKAVSAGVGISDMEKLTKAATKASQTFGGTTTEALNRFISAAQRGRVEIIQTLGVVIKTEQAYKDYAASIGKTALELTAQDRQQAILNATIKESERIFKDIVIDPNPFTQFASTMIDLKDTILTTITDAITPFISAINTSIPAALLVMGGIIKSIVGRMFPIFEDAVEAARKKGIESSRAVTEAQIQARHRRVKNLLEENIQIKGLTEKQLRKRLQLYLRHHGDVLAASGAFDKKLFDKQGRVNKVALVQLKAFLGRAESLRARGTVLKGSEQQSDRLLKNVRGIAAAIGVESKTFKAAAKDQANYTRAIKNTVVWYTRLGRKADAVFGRIKVVTASASSAFRSGFAGTFANAQDGFTGIGKAIKDTSRSWKIFGRDIGRGGITIGKSFLNIGRVAGRTAGLIGGIFATAMGPLFTLIFYLGILKVAFDSLAKKFGFTSYKLKQFKEGTEEFKESMEEIGDRIDKNIRQNKKSETSTQGLISKLEFLRGTVDSVANAFEKFDDKMRKLFDGATIFDPVNNNLIMLEEQVRNISTDIQNLGISGGQGSVSGSQMMETLKLRKELNKEWRNAEEAAKKAANQVKLVNKASVQLVKSGSIEPLITNFSKFNQVLKDAGFSQLEENVFSQLKGAKFDQLKEAIKWGNEETIIQALGALAKTDGQAVTDFLRAASEGAQEFKDKLVPLNKQITSLKTLQDVEGRLTNFVLGIDKLKNASVPNKEVVGFILDTRNALKTLQETGAEDILGNLTDLEGEIFTSDQLKALKDTFGIDENTGIGVAIGLLDEKFKPFKDIIDDSINAANRLKVITLTLTDLKEQEATTDSRKLEIAQKLHDLNVEQRKQERDAIRRRINANVQNLNLIVDGGGALSEQAKQLRLQLITDNDLLEIANRRVETAEDLRDVQRAQAAIDERALTNALNLIKAQESTNSFLQSITKNRIQELNLFKISNKLQKQQVAKQIELKEEQIANLKHKGISIEAQNEERAILEEQINLLKLQAEERTRINALQQEALQAEQDGIVPFSKEGSRISAKFFIEEVRKQTRNLKTAFETLGRGFAQNMFDTFDTMVDTLMEGTWGRGGRDFGRAVLETLKAGFRETIGNALKDAIKRSLLGLVNLSSAEDKQLEAQNQGNVLLGKIHDKMPTAEALKGKSSNVTNINSASMPKIGGELGDIIDTAINAGPLVQTQQQNNKSLESVEAIIAEQRDITKDGFLQNIKSLGLILWQLIKNAASDVAGGFMALFGFASGGIMRGRQPIPQFADGVVATRPQLAVIGEGKRNEAVVPLPNNREIPVDMKGAAGDTINIEQNFDFTNADTNAIPRLRNEARAIEDRTFNRVFTEINKGGRYAKIVGRR